MKDETTNHTENTKRVGNISRALSLILTALIIFTSATTVQADPGTTAMDFLKIGQGARAVAMGGAYTAIADDAYGLYWNPAGLGRVRKSSMTFQTNQYFADMSQNYFAMAIPSLMGTWGMSVNMLASGDMERTTMTSGKAGQVLGSFEARDLGISFGWGAEFSHGVTVGLSGRFLQSTIDDVSATAFAGDVGLQIQPVNNWSIGFALRNVGTGVKFMTVEDPLPTTFNLGTALRFLPGRNLIASLDLSKPKAESFVVNMGLELTLLEHFSFRGGYSLEGQSLSSGFTGGFGVHFGILDLDYAFVPYGKLDNTHRFGLTLQLEKLL